MPSTHRPVLTAFRHLHGWGILAMIFVSAFAVGQPDEDNVPAPGGRTPTTAESRQFRAPVSQALVGTVRKQSVPSRGNVFSRSATPSHGSRNTHVCHEWGHAFRAARILFRAARLYG